MKVSSEHLEALGARAYDRAVAGLATRCDEDSTYGRLASAVLDQGQGAYASSLVRLDGLGRSNSAGAIERSFDHLVEMWRCEALLALENFDRVQAVADEHVSLARQQGLGWALTGWSVVHGRLAAVRGQLDDAMRYLTPTTPASRTHVTAAFAAGEVALRRGDAGPSLQLALLRAKTAGQSPAPEVVSSGRWFMAQHAHATGHPQVGIHALALPRLRRDPLAEIDLIRVAIAASEHAAAERGAVTAAARARVNPTSTPLRVAAIHARALIDRDAAAMHYVVSSLTQRARPLALGDALVDLSDLVAPEDRISVLDAALSSYVTCGAACNARSVRRRLLDLGTTRRPRRRARPSTGWNALTASEIKVATLVARGLTNQKIADELIVSPHTVSSHIRSSFRKLAVSSRVQLTRVVLEHDEAFRGTS